MVIRTYFDRNNTIVYNNSVNVGRNPIAELYYGGDSSSKSYSRFIFQFDEARLKDLYTGGTFTDLSKLKHTLKMTNTGAFDTDLLGQTTCGDKERTCSFDLIVFPVTQDWDEGCGYDYGSCAYIGDGSEDYGPSNWFYGRTNTSWSGGTGIY